MNMHAVAHMNATKLHRAEIVPARKLLVYNGIAFLACDNYRHVLLLFVTT